MKKYGLIILITFICGMGCRNPNAQNKPAFNFPESDLNALPPASYPSLTQFYDNQALENRIVTFGG